MRNLSNQRQWVRNHSITKLCSAAVSAAFVGASRPHPRGQDALATAGKMPALQGCLIIDDAFLLQSLQKTAHVFTNLHRISPAVRRRKRGHDLLNRALPVAKFQDILPRPLNPNHAFRKKHDSFLALLPPSATSGKTGLAGI